MKMNSIYLHLSNNQAQLKVEVLRQAKPAGFTLGKSQCRRGSGVHRFISIA